MTARPKWKLPEPDLRPGAYFTSAVLDHQWAILTGPYSTHREALADVEAAKARALDVGGIKAQFAAYGTVHIEGDRLPTPKLGARP
jgi:hypothetical protein